MKQRCQMLGAVQAKTVCDWCQSIACVQAASTTSGVYTQMLIRVQRFSFIQMHSHWWASCTRVGLVCSCWTCA
jgi:hypothetical protein